MHGLNLEDDIAQAKAEGWIELDHLPKGVIGAHTVLVGLKDSVGKVTPYTGTLLVRSNPFPCATLQVTRVAGNVVLIDKFPLKQEGADLLTPLPPDAGCEFYIPAPYSFPIR